MTASECLFRLRCFGRLAALLSAVVIALLSGVAYAGITVLRNSGGLIPVGNLAANDIAVVTIGDPHGDVFRDYCSRYIALADDRDLSGCRLLIAVYSSTDESVRRFGKLYDPKSSIAVFFIPNAEVSRFSSVGNITELVLAGGSSAPEQKLAGEVIFGGKSIDSRLTSDIKGVARRGDGISLPKTRLGYSSPSTEGFASGLERSIDSIVDLNISEGSFPGCQVLVAKNGNIVIDKAYGSLDSRNKTAKVDRRTIYDVASMTKATATIAGLMKAYERGLFRLDDRVSRYLPRLRATDKEDLTVRELLHHESGLPATVNTFALMVDSSSFTGKLMKYKRAAPYTVKVDKGVYGHSSAHLRPDLFRTTPSEKFNVEVAKSLYGSQEMVDRMYDAIYAVSPGAKKYLYSCLNFCILKDMEEALTGIRHDKWVVDNVFAPIGATSAVFCPGAKGIKNIASTENDRFMRKQTLCGYVHDEKAAYCGGVQGNAGLFSNASDIAKLCQTWLNGGVYGDVRVFEESTVTLFTTEKSSTIDRGLAFDRPSRLKSMAEIDMPLSVFGHTGFTGTCFWVDPENDIIVVFLSNRVNPSRDNPAFDKLNPRKALLMCIYNSLRAAGK